MNEMKATEISHEKRRSMPALKIGVVEDEIVIAENITAILRQLGYEVPEPANDYIEAVSMITKHKPDLVLLDIMLEDDRDGIDLATRINNEFNIPFIFLTANADVVTIMRAKNTEPAAYLIKPFTKNDLYASIEIAARKHQLHGSDQGKESAVFIKDGNTLCKLYKHEIVNIEAERVYINVHMRSRSVLLRRSIAQMLEELDDPRFVQIHRSHVINIHHVEQVNTTEVVLGGKVLPVSRANRQKLSDLIAKGSN